jgi:hypothetical protein
LPSSLSRGASRDVAIVNGMIATVLQGDNLTLSWA